MAYSVFFPVGFNFVKAGKLPGLYGGKRGCSGGSAAENCFSARLMWRTGGKGEVRSLSIPVVDFSLRTRLRRCTSTLLARSRSKLSAQSYPFRTATTSMGS